MQAQSVDLKIPFTIQRWLLLGVTSIILYLSFLLTIFTPYPIVLAGVFYGRRPAYALLASAWVLMLFISYWMSDGLFLVSSFSLAMLFAALIMEVVLRNKNPIRGVVMIGTSFLLLVGAVVGGATLTGVFQPKEYLVQELQKQKESYEVLQKELLNSPESNSLEIAALLDQPEVLATEFLKTAPIYLILAVFISLWVNTFMVLRSRRILYGGSYTKNGVTEISLLRFRVPEYFVWAVIVGLVLVVFTSHIVLETLGMMILSGLGVFYFFQGFSIFLDFLSKWRIFGFFRLLIVMFSVVTASWAFALIGLFDGFFDFRKFLKKENKN